MKKLFTLSIFFVFIITLNGCTKSAESVCNKVLNAAKKGVLFNNLLGTNYINDDYRKYFDNSPKEDITYLTEIILLPEYFDSYKFLSSKSHSNLVVHRSANLSIFGAKGSKGYEDSKSYYLSKEKARLENETVYYEEGEAEILSLEYLIEGKNRHKLTIYCMKQEKDWKIYMAYYEPIRI